MAAFWEQLPSGKTSLASVTNFAYLKELVDPKVRTERDGLSFTTEGYESAKNVLVVGQVRMRTCRIL